MAKKIAMFNHKGGVSKTTTTFNLGWKLSELGYKVLIVDTDPQCNLTGLCLSLTNDANFEEFYQQSGISNLKSALDPIFSGNLQPLLPATCYEFPNRDGLYLLPGHINVSDFDVTISIAQELTGSLRLVQNVPGAINELLRLTTERYEFDYILIDMSPSVSATNANLLMLSDYFMIPCSPDYFCNMAISSLTEVLPNWNATYQTIKTHPAFNDAVYKFPNTTPKFIGTIQQRYRPRNGEPARSFQSWINIINNNVINRLVPALRANNMIIEEERFTELVLPEEPYNLINIADFNSLIAQSQQHNTPIFRLTNQQINQAGQVLDNMVISRDGFNKTFTTFANAVVAITN
ncbi:cobyrinic acid a,c-diamide synthase [Chryseobacterium carnipullorum]|uniref:Cobyrinic acid a,c-diamide synthase n=1 Tax=Chryseobacterium carnipullorum TaxID=1124835 RepID=A0A376DRM8_CHRCU|nr:AAA family ATPase [Chryseobacterium carnipullorum]AZA49387.1 cobyrinic acid a,c-diamide synthase [Chryseobacterium carnipullorum]AZA64275.1 cobyrinic acid a,c-diamide synthase [Chryseobacterium carnipullorum]STC94244.1 Sporulation initiation inhibitor protein soj [Chryseobacterium carnipullorum]